MIKVNLPDGTVLRFPEGTSEEVMRQAIKKLPVKDTTEEAFTQPTVETQPKESNPFGSDNRQADLATNDEFFNTIQEEVLLRQGGSGLAAMAGRTAASLGGKTNLQLGGNESRQEIVDMWLENHRLLSVGQSITLGNEVALVSSLSDEDKVKLNNGYKLFDSLQNVYSGDTSVGEKWEATKDYTSGALWDFTNLIGFGTGKAFAAGGTKAAVVALKVAVDESVKKAAKEATKQGLKGVAKEAFIKKAKNETLTGGMSIIKNNAAKKELGAMLATDFVIEVGKDVLYQNKVQMRLDEDRSYSYTQTALSALGAIAMPAVVYGAKGTAKAASVVSEKFASKYNTKDLFASYNNASLKAEKMSSNEIKAEILGRLNQSQASSSIKGQFDNFLKDRESLDSWQIAKKEANDELLAQGITPSNTFETVDFYRRLFFGSKNSSGQVLGEGLVHSMSRDGISFKPLDKDDKIANFLGDAINYLDPQTLKKVVVDYEKATGTSLGFDLTKSAKDLRKDISNFWKVDSSMAGMTNQINSLGSRILGKEYTMEDLLKLTENIGVTPKEKDPSYGAWLLSVRNRLLTAHPATSAVNFRGWGYMAGANTLSDIVEGSLNYVAGKALGNVEQAVRGKGSFLGATRKAYDILNWDATVEEGLELIENLPRAKEDLFRIMSGDVGIKDTREFYNLGDKNKAINAAESYITFMQKIWGVNLVDQQTKVISFVSNLNQAIMRSYDTRLQDFLANPKWQVELKSKKFSDTYEEALTKTLRETGAYSWSDKVGDSPALYLAKAIENFSNSTKSGWFLPFGRWFNTSTAFISDFTGASLLYNGVLKSVGATGKALGKGNKWEKAGGVDLMADLAKAATFWGGVAFYSDEADKKLADGTPWNIKVHDDGTREDLTNQFPRNVFAFVAQQMAHLRKDGTIPPELNEDGAETLITSAFRAPADAIQDIKDMFQMVYDGDLQKAIAELVGKVGSSNISAMTRSLDPINNTILLFTDDFDVPDRRQGAEYLNQSLRYIDQIFAGPETVERQDPTKGGAKTRDISKTFTGFSSSNQVAVADRMIASVGRQNWREIKWTGDPIVKNRLDKILSTVINSVARDKLGRYPDFEEMPLDKRQLIVDQMISESKDLATSIFESGYGDRDKALVALKKLNSFSDKRALEKAKEALKVDDLADLVAEPGGAETLEMLLYTAKAYATPILD